MDGIDKLPTTELHREIGGGILDLHSFDDNELLTEVTDVLVLQDLPVYHPMFRNKKCNIHGYWGLFSVIIC
jgi:hypothetical protein